MLAAYVDDSGHPIRDDAFVLSAFVASAREWSRLMRPWLGAIHRCGVSAFHAVDCANGGEEFKGWSSSRKKKLFKGTIDLLVRHTTMKGYSAGLMVNDYARVAGPQVKELLRDGPLPFTFAVLLELIAKRVNEPVAFIVDKPSKGWGAMEEWFEKMRSYSDGRAWRKNLHSLTPSNVRDAPAIQVSDLLAYETYRHLKAIAKLRLGTQPRVSRKSLIRLVREKKPVGWYFDEENLGQLIDYGRELGIIL